MHFSNKFTRLCILIMAKKKGLLILKTNFNNYNNTYRQASFGAKLSNEFKNVAQNSQKFCKDCYGENSTNYIFTNFCIDQISKIKPNLNIDFVKINSKTDIFGWSINPSHDCYAVQISDGKKEEFVHSFSVNKILDLQELKNIVRVLMSWKD